MRLNNACKYLFALGGVHIGSPPPTLRPLGFSFLLEEGGGSSGSNDDNSIMATAFDMNLGVEQRITGSETEQLRIRNVLRKMYTYFEEEVLSRSEYEHVRGRW